MNTQNYDINITVTTTATKTVVLVVFLSSRWLRSGQPNAFANLREYGLHVRFLLPPLHKSSNGGTGVLFISIVVAVVIVVLVSVSVVVVIIVIVS